MHIHVKGNWTRRFRSQLHYSEMLNDERRQQEEVGPKSPMTFLPAKHKWVEYPTVNVDGPFDTVSDDVLAHDISVLVGAGVGVTPFAPWLKTLRYGILGWCWWCWWYPSPRRTPLRSLISHHL